MKRVSVFLVTLVVALGTAGFTAAAPSPGAKEWRTADTSTSEYCMDAEEQAFLTLINTYRVQNGLGTLTAVQTAGAAADHHSTDMATKNYFSHTLIDGTTYTQNMVNHGYTKSGGWVGENIAAGYSTASRVFAAWKASSSHNSNMLSPWFTAIGIGRAYGSGSTYGWYWTTDFGGYVDGLALACPANTLPTNTPVPSGTPTNTPVPSSTPTKTPSPQSTSTPNSSPTPRLTSTNTPTSQPTATNTVTSQPTATQTPPPPTATQTPSPQPTATNTPAPQPTATTAPVVSVYVANMTGKATTKRGATTLAVTATVKDSKGANVSGASVTIIVVMPNGSSQSLSATTNGRGQVSWSIKATGGSGTYVASVTVVSAGSRTYDPGQNAINSVAMVVP